MRRRARQSDTVSARITRERGVTATTCGYVRLILVYHERSLFDADSARRPRQWARTFRVVRVSG